MVNLQERTTSTEAVVEETPEAVDPEDIHVATTEVVPIQEGDLIQETQGVRVEYSAGGVRNMDIMQTNAKPLYQRF